MQKAGFFPAVNRFRAMTGEEKPAEFISKYMFCFEKNAACQRKGRKK
jgi:hypothetical protein